MTSMALCMVASSPINLTCDGRSTNMTEVDSKVGSTGRDLLTASHYRSEEALECLRLSTGYATVAWALGHPLATQSNTKRMKNPGMMRSDATHGFLST